MAKTTFRGPVQVGPIKEGALSALGDIVLSQQIVFVPTASITVVTDADGQNVSQYNGIPAFAWAATAAAVTGSFNLPPNASILDIVIDQSVLTTGGTAINATAGVSAAGLEYMPLVDLKAAVRLRPAFIAANLIAMQNTTTNNVFYFQIVPTISAVTAGIIGVTVTYIQN